MAPIAKIENQLYPQSERQRFEILRSQLETERATFLPHWRDLGDNILPRRPRFLITDNNRGDRRNQKIIDSTSTMCARTLRSGMMSGVTSPARPWFELRTTDEDLNDNELVKEWLYDSSQRMRTAFLQSNLYQNLPLVYGDLGTFSTAAMFMEEDMENVFNFTTFPIGSYCIANDSKGRVRVFYREFQVTVRQILEMFAVKNDKGEILNWEVFSEQVQGMWARGELDLRVDIVHVVQPNKYYNPNMLHARFKRFSSDYYERGMATGGATAMNFDDDRFLRRSGFDWFPILAPRWETNAEDTYGTSCPGMDVLGDTKQLQIGERLKMRAIEKMVNPPLVGPNVLKSQAVSLLPGGVSYLDSREGQVGLRPIHEVKLDISHLEQNQSEMRGRIQDGYFTNLFLMMTESDRREITAREIDERHEEKLLALGPVLEQLNQDLLDPMITIAFAIMKRRGMFKQMPEVLAKANITVEYTSIMAQAQKAIGLGGADRFSTFVNTLVQFYPEAANSVNIHEQIQNYADLTSVKPGIVRTEDQMNQLKAQAQKAAAAQQGAELAKQGAEAAQKLSMTDTSKPSALRDLIRQGAAGSPIQQQ